MSATALPECPAAKGVALQINVLSETGRYLTSESVTDADLSPLRSEAWFESFVRKGKPGVAFSDVAFRVVFLPKVESDPACAGFALEAEATRGGAGRCKFPRWALRHVASRATERLLKCGVLKPGDTYHFEIAMESEPQRSPMADPALGAGKVTVKSPPLHFLSVSLRALRQDSRSVDAQEDEAFSVFFTEAAFAVSERFSRQGANENKPIESGAALAGFLCLAHDNGEGGDLCVVVTDVLEAVHAAGTELSLTYTSESWSRIGRIATARQTVQPAFRLCGSAHGHNFSPGEPCASCFKTAAPCGSHNVIPSTADLLWTQSVFAHQPWALCQIFGANARGEALHGLFTLRHGRFQRRGFFVLPTFAPQQWKTICATDLNPK